MLLFFQLQALFAFAKVKYFSLSVEICEYDEFILWLIVWNRIKRVTVKSPKNGLLYA